MPQLSDPALDVLFRTARTHRAWLPEPVPDELIHRLYDLLKLGPTSGNSSPARTLFVKSEEAKARLLPAMAEGNVEKTRTAPLTAIVAYDLEFYEKLPELNPYMGKAAFEGQPDLILGDRPPQQQPAGRLPHHGGARAGTRLRSYVRIRRRQGQRRILLRRQMEGKLHL